MIIIKPCDCTGGSKTEYVCDQCTKVCNIGEMGNAIAVYFPYGHKLDSMNSRGSDSENHFCSSNCLVEYIKTRE